MVVHNIWIFHRVMVIRIVRNYWNRKRQRRKWRMKRSVNNNKKTRLHITFSLFRLEDKRPNIVSTKAHIHTYYAYRLWVEREKTSRSLIIIKLIIVNVQKTNRTQSSRSSTKNQPANQKNLNLLNVKKNYICKQRKCNIRLLWLHMRVLSELVRCIRLLHTVK